MDNAISELVAYARAHGISTDHTRLNYWSLLSGTATLPLPNRTTEWLGKKPSPAYSLLREDLQINGQAIKYIENFINPELVDFNDRQYVDLETLPNVAFEMMKLDDPEVRGPVVKPYLERVGPFAYMGNMNVPDPEVEEEEPGWLSAPDKFLFKEKLQISVDVMRLLEEVTTRTEINTNRVFTYSSVDRGQYRFSSPLLALEREPEQFEPTSELLTSIPESPLSKWSISETLSPASSVVGLISMTASSSLSSPLVPTKRVQQMHFSSPVLPAAATAKRIKTIPFPDDGDEVALEAASPTAYSQLLLQRRDNQLASQMRLDAALATSILQSENISQVDLALRIEYPVVVPLETAVQRRSRIKLSFPATMKDIKARVKEWRKQGNEWTIKWKPFEFGKEDALKQQQELECIDDDMVIEMLTDSDLDNMEHPRRSNIVDWELSDEDHTIDMENLQFDVDEDSNHLSPDCPPKLEESAETLEDLLAYRKSNPTQVALDDGDVKQMNEFLPVNPFELYAFDSSTNVVGNLDTEEDELAEEQVREEQRYRDRIDAARAHDTVIKNLGVTEFDPETKIIVNTTFLKLNRTTYCDLLDCTSGLTAIERDYGPTEADILLSSSCGLLVCSFAQILQREQDGTRVVVKRAQDVFQRVERLCILVCISPTTGFKSQSDWSALADFMATLAGIRILLVKETESVGVLISMCQQFGGQGNGMADVETTWERFLRKVGVNAYAAQEILKIMPLKKFIECGHDERLNAFLDLVGLKVLVTVI
ncbi:hypothetical protein V1525DRAFT_452195 [Lipomyces kononenkoae]|uniref:Uncharacterized protein n=1 Tax=Lipomyces kononenkoae TaxID=34357 RepID=A0ACC3SUC8_LIPKO